MSLAIVIPVYNEEKNIRKLINDWDKTVRKYYKSKYKFIVINDGSTDKTHKILKSMNIKKRLYYVLQKNAGHGNACIKGYKIALKLKFKMIMQIDSDNQCDPVYFKNFSELVKKNNVIFGNRVSREDGLIRVIFSRILALLIYIKTFTYIRDANVPYRLMKRNILSNIIHKIPKNIILKNCYLSYLIEKKYEIKWVNINFRKRYHGQTKYGFYKLIKQVFNLLYYI